MPCQHVQPLSLCSQTMMFWVNKKTSHFQATDTRALPIFATWLLGHKPVYVTGPRKGISKSLYKAQSDSSSIQAIELFRVFPLPGFWWCESRIRAPKNSSVVPHWILIHIKAGRDGSRGKFCNSRTGCELWRWRHGFRGRHLRCCGHGRSPVWLWPRHLRSVTHYLTVQALRQSAF